MLKNILRVQTVCRPYQSIQFNFSRNKFKESIKTRFTSKEKWKGRMEYLNRGDPFADKRDPSETFVPKSANINVKQSDRISRRQRVYVWGNGECGALGQLGFIHPRGNREKILSMRRPFISNLGNYYNLKTVACGNGFTLFVSDDKEKYLFGTGLNNFGQLGYQRRLDEAGKQIGKPLEMLIVPSAIHLPLKKDEKVTSVAAGRTHSLAMTNLGRVMSWGNNSYGQCGRPIIENEDYFRNKVVHEMEVDCVTKIVVGQDHSLLVNVVGEVFSCGWGADGQTGQGHYNTSGDLTQLAGDIQGVKIVKVACAGDCVLALSEDGDVFGWGNSEYNQLSSVTSEQQVNVPTHLPLPDVGRVVDIASGGTVCLVVNTEGQVWVWGYGLLGKGPKLESSKIPTRIPDPIFGNNMFGNESKVEKVFAGLGTQAAVTNYGDMFIWGKNRQGCLGLHTDEDRYFPMKVPIGGRVTHVSLGCDHSAAVVKPWMS